MSEANTLDRYADRRRHSRRPVNKNAELTLRSGEDVYDCIVIDESDGGVQVDLGEEVDLPDEVVIRFSDQASQLVRRCWSLGTKVGYQFITPAAAPRREVRDTPPPARELDETFSMGEFARISPAALGLSQLQMDFTYPAERIAAQLRNRPAASRLKPLDAASFFGSGWRMLQPQ